MNLTLIRIGFVVIGGLLGVQFSSQSSILPWWAWFVTGGAIGALLVGLETLLHRVGRISVRGFSAAVFGLLMGLIMAKLVSDAIGMADVEAGLMGLIRVVITWAFGYIGMVQALRGRDEFNVIIPYVRLSRYDKGDELFVIDTSAIIDGRIVDLCKTRFLQGRLLVPRFVLRELQALADSSDGMKRARGRRGLDILHELRSQANSEVRIHDDEMAGIPEVDAKLVKLAQVVGAKVVTTDYNLNRVSELQGVPVLNVNELAKALRPVVLPGEMLEVKPIKDGKEPHQSVAYLEDGTMVVVEQGRHLIGQMVRGMVTSVLQTSAGRMVFVRPEGAPGAGTAAPAATPPRRP